MKKRIINFIAVIGISGTIAAQGTGNKLLGNWSAQQELLPYTNANYYWHFMADGKGSLDGATYLTSRASIICNFEMPFTWSLRGDSVTVVYGSATCTCNPTPAHSDADIEKRAAEINGIFSNKTKSFPIRFIKRKLVKLGDMVLKKE